MSDVTTVADLTAEHYGWMIRVTERDGSVVTHLTFELGKGFGCGIRHFTRPDGSDMVRLTDESGRSGVFVGSERTYPADTPCELIRPVSKAARRAARSGPSVGSVVPTDNQNG